MEHPDEHQAGRASQPVPCITIEVPGFCGASIAQLLNLTRSRPLSCTLDAVRLMTFPFAECFAENIAVALPPNRCAQTATRKSER